MSFLAFSTSIARRAAVLAAIVFPNLTQALLDRGYSETDAKKIMGENFLHLFQEVWVE